MRAVGVTKRTGKGRGLEPWQAHPGVGREAGQGQRAAGPSDWFRDAEAGRFPVTWGHERGGIWAASRLARWGRWLFFPQRAPGRRGKPPGIKGIAALADAGKPARPQAAGAAGGRPRQPRTECPLPRDRDPGEGAGVVTALGVQGQRSCHGSVTPSRDSPRDTRRDTPLGQPPAPGGQLPGRASQRGNPLQKRALPGQQPSRAALARALAYVNAYLRIYVNTRIASSCSPLGWLLLPAVLCSLAASERGPFHSAPFCPLGRPGSGRIPAFRDFRDARRVLP
jgi:hypothetical protein